MSTRPTEDLASGARRMIRALGPRIANGEAAELAHLVELQSVLAGVLDEAVRGLRHHGITDGEIAAELGVTRQAVSKRWPGGGLRKGRRGIYPPAS